MEAWTGMNKFALLCIQENFDCQGTRPSVHCVTDLLLHHSIYSAHLSFPKASVLHWYNRKSLIDERISHSCIDPFEKLRENCSRKKPLTNPKSVLYPGQYQLSYRRSLKLSPGIRQRSRELLLLFLHTIIQLIDPFLIHRCTFNISNDPEAMSHTKS